MSYLDKFLDWPRNHPTQFVAIAVSQAIVAMMFVVLSVLWLSPEADSNRMISPSIKMSGFQRLYPRVRKGDDYFMRGDYPESLYSYRHAVDILRILQEEFPDRADEYRDAERTVRSRILLVEAAEGIKHIYGR